MEMKDKSEKMGKEYEEKGLSKLLVDEDIFLMHLIFKNQESQEKNKGLKKQAIEDKDAAKELTDALMERIIELNPELSDKELKQLIADKYMAMKTRKVVSLKPVEDRFKERIDKYMNQVREVRLK
jgi:beta-phosphoglucomutase-like phosphatase (HAD superfamily)